MQWLIDIIEEWLCTIPQCLRDYIATEIAALQNWVVAQGYLPAGFVDRGGAGAPDYTIVDFTRDGAWHDLDLSGKIAPSTKGVCLRIKFRATQTIHKLFFRPNGYVNQASAHICQCPVANVVHNEDITIAIDANNKIEYWATAGAFNLIDLTVANSWL